MTAERVQGWKEAAAWLRELAAQVDASVTPGSELRADCERMVTHYKTAADDIDEQAARLERNATP